MASNFSAALRQRMRDIFYILRNSTFPARILYRITAPLHFLHASSQNVAKSSEHHQQESEVWEKARGKRKRRVVSRISRVSGGEAAGQQSWKVARLQQSHPEASLVRWKDRWHLILAKRLAPSSSIGLKKENHRPISLMSTVAEFLIKV